MTLRSIKIMYWIIFGVGSIPLIYSLFNQSGIFVAVSIGAAFLLFAFSILMERDNSKDKVYFVATRYGFAALTVISVFLFLLPN